MHLGKYDLTLPYTRVWYGTILGKFLVEHALGEVWIKLAYPYIYRRVISI